MRLDHDGALTRECGWCAALPDEECWHLNGNRPRFQSPPRHAVRLWVWEEQDMLLPCGYCAAQPGEPCRTVGNGYPRTTTALRPHAIRRATSPTADSPAGITHARDPDRPYAALCGVGVTAPPGSAGRVECRACRQIRAHRDMLATRRTAG